MPIQTHAPNHDLVKATAESIGFDRVWFYDVHPGHVVIVALSKAGHTQTVVDTRSWRQRRKDRP